MNYSDIQAANELRYQEEHEIENNCPLQPKLQDLAHDQFYGDLLRDCEAIRNGSILFKDND